jgi:hypothetical protein
MRVDLSDLLPLCQAGGSCCRLAGQPSLPPWLARRRATWVRTRPCPRTACASCPLSQAARGHGGSQLPRLRRVAVRHVHFAVFPYSRISTDFEKFILWLLMRCMELLDDTDELCKVCSIA